MKQKLFFHCLALLGALAIFGGTAALAASNLETVPVRTESLFNDDFLQGNEPGIGELLENTLPSNSGSSEPTGSEPSSSISSQESASGNPVSSKPASSKPSSGTSSSSKTASGSSSEKPASSHAQSSKPASSQQPSSEASSSQPESSEPVSSEENEPSSEEESSEPSAPEIDDALLDAVAGAVQREIVGVNTAPKASCYEAYKAQAVAAHTYMEYHRQRTGSYPTMSYAKPNPKVTALVAEVLNELMYYNGSVINASYHAASGGHTQSAEYVWGNPIPYLAAVESAYDDYESTCTISLSQMESKLLSAGLHLWDDPSQWFDLANATYTDGDFVWKISVCGTSVTGRALRETILGTDKLKSPKITDIQFDGSNFIFHTKGFGHGVGMSQQGALGYAAHEDWDYRMILNHYYPGVTIQ